MFHILPHHLPASDDLLALAFELYDRILKPIHPISIRGLPLECPSSTAQAPHFTIVDEEQRKPELTLAWPLKSYDVLNRWKMVHCAYAYDDETGVMAGMVVDSEGSLWDVKTWMGLPKPRDRVQAVWEYFLDVAGEVAVEHRLVISCLSIMSISEWTSKYYFHLAAVFDTSR